MNTMIFKFAHYINNTVYALYSMNLVEFFVKWENINAQGVIDDFDLSLDVICSNEAYQDCIINAITAGDRDDNKDLELYLFIRNTFDSQNCQDLYEKANNDN